MCDLNTLLNLMEELDLSPGPLARLRSRYNYKMSEYGNEVYALDETRLIHWMNYVSGDWFSRRLDPYLCIRDHFELVMDLGFSIAYPYLVERRSSEPRYLFIDREESARRFYEVLVKHAPNVQGADRDKVILADIETDEGQERILNALEESEARATLFVLSEVVEHLVNFAAAFALLRDCLGVVKLPERSRVYVTLPVGRQIPSHTIEFRHADEAREFVAQWLEPLEEQVLRPAPDEFVTPYLTECYCCLGRLREIA